MIISYREDLGLRGTGETWPGVVSDLSSKLRETLGED